MTTSHLTMDQATLVFKCQGSFIEGVFRFSDTVAHMKAELCSRLPGSPSPEQVRFQVSDQEVLQNEQQSLSEVFKQCGIAPNVLIHVHIQRQPSSIPSTSAPAHSRVPLQQILTRREPPADKGSVESQFQMSSPAKHHPPTISCDQGVLTTAVKASLSMPSFAIVDALCNRLGGADQEIVTLIYAAAVEDSDDLDRQAQFLVDKINELGLGQNDDIDTYYDVQEELDQEDGMDVRGRLLTCPVCFDQFQIRHIFEFNCGIDQNYTGPPHSLCYVCAENHVRSFIGQGNPNLKCFAIDCNHLMLPQEIAMILGRGDISKGMKDRRYVEIDKLQCDHAIGKDPSKFSSCPTEGCHWQVERSQDGAAEKATCPLCKLEFCTNCLSLYHYRSTCIESRQLQDQWRTWIISGRALYWQQDKPMCAKAERLAALEKDRLESSRLIEAQDEQWKAQNCRHCPHCGRLVNKIAGCNAMRCGYDTDTRSNVQNGCLRAFDWNTAKSYKPVKVGVRVRQTPAPMQEKASSRLLEMWLWQRYCGSSV